VELLDLLGESRDFLERSARAFDDGYVAEAKRLAVALRVLLHDTQQSHSLLKQLRVKDTLAFLDTAEPINPHNLAPTPGLVLMRMTATVTGGTGDYIAPLGMERPFGVRHVAFAGWWNHAVMKVGETWSRKDLVLTLSNQEGGAHVDPSLDERYDRLAKRNGLGWTTSSGDAATPFNGNVVAIAVRQVAYEVLDTLDRARDRLA
jgi:hypothetical protein